jgi:DNA repair protein RadC
MIRDMPPSERPTERLLDSGPGALTTSELIAVILRTGTGGRSVTRVAEEVLSRSGGLNGLLRAPISQLRTYRGVGKVKAAQLKAALELAQRLVREDPEQRRQVRSPSDICDLLLLEMSALEHEQFRVVLLDNKNRVVSVRKLYDGSVNTSIVRVAEVFRDAIRENCPALVVVHNHPSGDPTPSGEDVLVTREIVAAGRLLQIDVLDHVILGRGPVKYESLKQRGLGFEQNSMKSQR